MNANGKMLELGKALSCPVAQDEYEGGGYRYIVFTYEDERGSLYGDNGKKAVTAWLQISLYVPKEQDYFADRDKMEKTLISLGFQVESVQSWTEHVAGRKLRRVIFSANITE